MVMNGKAQEIKPEREALLPYLRPVELQKETIFNLLTSSVATLKKLMAQFNLNEAIKDALEAAAKKAVGASRDLRVETDPKTGKLRAYAKLVIVDRVTNPQDEISRFDALQIVDEANLGDEIEKEVTPTGFGRIAAQYASQNLKQHLRRAEKALIFDEFRRLETPS